MGKSNFPKSTISSETHLSLGNGFPSFFDQHFFLNIVLFSGKPLAKQQHSIWWQEEETPSEQGIDCHNL